MKKKLLSLIMVGAMVLSMTACGQGGNTGSGNTGSGAATGNGALPGTLKIGVIAPITGGAAI